MEKKTLLLECEICHITSTDSRLLPCSHHFCLKCLEKQIDENAMDKTGSQHCSICGKEWFVPDADGVKGLFCISKNVYFESFIQSLQSFKKCIMANDGGMHEIVEDFCITCWDILCVSCALVHCKTKLTLSHEIKKITDISVDDFEHHERHKSKKENVDYCLCCDDCLDFASMLCNRTLNCKTNNKDKTKSSPLEAYKKLLNLEHEIGISANNHKIFDKMIEEKCCDHLAEVEVYLENLGEKVNSIHEKIIAELHNIRKTVSQIITTKQEKEIESRREILEKYEGKLLEVKNLKTILEKQLSYSELKSLKTEYFLDAPIEQKNKLELQITGITEWKGKVSEWLKPLLNLTYNLTCPQLTANDISFLCPAVSNVQQQIIQQIPISNKSLTNGNAGCMTSVLMYQPIMDQQNTFSNYITQPSMPIQTNPSLNSFQPISNPLPTYNPYISQPPGFEMLNTNRILGLADAVKLNSLPQQSRNQPQKHSALPSSGNNSTLQMALTSQAQQVPTVPNNQPSPDISCSLQEMFAYDSVLATNYLAKMPIAEQKQALGEELYPLIQLIYPDLAGKITGMLLELDNEELLMMLNDYDILKGYVEEAVKTLKDASVKLQEKHEVRF